MNPELLYSSKSPVFPIHKSALSLQCIIPTTVNKQQVVNDIPTIKYYIPKHEFSK